MPTLRIQPRWARAALIGLSCLGALVCGNPGSALDSSSPVESAKVTPLLEDLLRECEAAVRDCKRPLLLLVVFKDSLVLPHVAPDLDPNEPEDSKTNRARLARTEQRVEELLEVRAKEVQGHVDRLLWSRGVPTRIVEPFWLINGALLEMPASAVREFARDSAVVSVSLNSPGASPPSP